MAEAVLIIITSLLALLGLTELMTAVWLKIISPKEHLPVFKVIMLDGDSPEQHLRYAAESAKWRGADGTDFTVIVVDGLSGGECAMCRYIASQHDMVLCSPDALAGVIKSLSRGK